MWSVNQEIIHILLIIFKQSCIQIIIAILKIWLLSYEFNLVPKNLKSRRMQDHSLNETFPLPNIWRWSANKWDNRIYIYMWGHCRKWYWRWWLHIIPYSSIDPYTSIMKASLLLFMDQYFLFPLRYLTDPYSSIIKGELKDPFFQCKI
jgi:hypothetical protein